MIGNIGRPGWNYYGEAFGGDSPEKTPFLEQVVPLIPAIIESTTDPYKRAEILQVKIAKLRARGASPYTIAKYEAKLRAAQRRVGEDEEFETEKEEWSFIGKAAAMTGIAVGVAVILRILRKP